MPKKIIVVLANSVKHQQHCVAGKCIITKKWIRPVANANGAELSHDQAKYENPYGKFNVKPKQKIEISLESHVPLPNQPDNYLIDNIRWQQKYVIEDHELSNYLDSPNDLWGQGDRVPFSVIENEEIIVTQSLYLVQVENLELYMNQYDKRRASFHYNGHAYDLAVTDPNFDTILNDEIEANGVLCISLGEEFEGNCYKLVATIF